MTIVPYALVDRPIVCVPSRVPGARWEKWTHGHDVSETPFFWRLWDTSGRWSDPYLAQVTCHRSIANPGETTRTYWAGSIYVLSFGRGPLRAVMREIEARCLRGDLAEQQARQADFNAHYHPCTTCGYESWFEHDARRVCAQCVYEEEREERERKARTP